VNEAERFWNAFEAETGEKVLARSIGIWHEGGDPKGLWGIAILTDAAFRFKYIPGQSLILGLIRPPGAKESEREEIDFIAPFGRILELKGEKRGFLDRLFGGPFRRVELSWREGEAGIRTESFSIDPSGGIPDRLRLAISDRAEGD